MIETMMEEVKRCGSCGAPIVWRKSDRSGRVAPLDATPSERGNCALVGDHEYMTYGPRQAEEERAAGAALYTSHFVTCPQARAWSKAGRRTS